MVTTVGCMKRLLVVLAASAGLLVGCASAETPSAGQPAGQPADPAAEQSSAPTVAQTSPSASPTSSPPPTASATTAVPTPAPRPGTTITTAASEFGEVLFDGAGQAIYLFDQEETGTPVCYDECAVAWPPVLTDGTPVAADGADPAALGTTPRTDGSMQVTYGGHPLYFYAHEGPNEVRCHNVSGFGGLWLAISPAGEPAPF